LIAVGVLIAAGLAKAWQPSDTANALAGAGIPASSSAVRIGALAEAAIGVYALVEGGRVAAVLVAASYLAFAAFVSLALVRRLPLATCGCFGRADTPPDLLHLGIVVACAVAAVIVVFDPGVGLGDIAAEQPLAGLPFFLLVGVGTTLAILALTSLSRTLALVRGRDSS
jgi:hypothetical protein